MGKRGKKARQVRDGSETTSSSPEEEAKVVVSISDDDDDDAEANEDLSLKIIEKAKRRAAKKKEAALDSVTMVTNLIDESSSDVKKEKKKKKKTKEKKISKKKRKEGEELNAEVPIDVDTNFKSFCGELFVGDDVKEQKTEAEKVTDVIDKPAETNPVEASDNAVLRRLLRGPRYFDPPDSGWGNCYNCGEEGHAAVNCTAAKRKKPCFVCGSLEHNAKQCTKRQDCFICKKGGHRAKDCPEKSRGGSQKICLKCGDAGHDMFSCRNSYSPDDLKEIQCYVCRKFGHLCCVEYTDSGPKDVSCYRCGALGHTGRTCMRPSTETSGGVSLSSCYRCGKEGHFARECTSSAKAGKRNREWSTPKKIKFNDDMDYEVRSVPNDLGKDRKKKKIEYEGRSTSASKSKHRGGGWSTEDPGDYVGYEGGFPSDIKSKRRGGGDYVEYEGGFPSDIKTKRRGCGDYVEYERGFPSDIKSKRRGGWTTEHPGDFHSSKQKTTGWRSPATPSNNYGRNSNYAAGGHAWGSHSESPHNLGYSNSSSYRLANYYNQHSFSASRFGNNSNNPRQRNYDW